MKRHTFFATLIGLCLAIGAMPLQANNLTLIDNSTTTKVSGYAGQFKSVGPTGGFRGISAIEWWEDRDKPCKLELTTKHFNNGDTNQPEIILDGVTTNLGTKQCATPGNRKWIGLSGTDDWIYKVQVCTTDKNQTSKNKLKGIRIWARSVNNRSPLEIISQSANQETKHAHCDKWHTAQACPTGKVASRIRVHHDASEEQIIGLALECRTLTDN